MDKKPFSRAQRMAELIRIELGGLLLRQSQDPRFKNISITSLDMSPDLRSAKVFFTSFDKSDIAATTKALNKASGFFRHNLAKISTARGIPKLEFCYDESVVYGSRIDSVLSNLPKANLDDDDDNV